MKDKELRLKLNKLGLIRCHDDGDFSSNTFAPSAIHSIECLEERVENQLTIITELLLHLDLKIEDGLRLVENED